MDHVKYSDENAALYEKKGYLNNNFRIFHLTDCQPMEFAYHYHDFDKILLFIKGKVAYSVEGRKYDLRPYDIVLINAGELHRPIVQAFEPYERIIIYISAGFLGKYEGDADLRYCLKQAAEKQSNVLRIDNLSKNRLFTVCKELEASFESTEYANVLYQKVLFLEFMIGLNRALINNHAGYLEMMVSNERIAELIDYINHHLTDDLGVDTIASHFYLSRSYLMHLFKAETGCSVGAYINEKRLLTAKSMIQNGVSVTQACYNSGFRDYSTFSRAFRKMFHTTPKNSGNIY